MALSSIVCGVSLSQKKKVGEILRRHADSGVSGVAMTGGDTGVTMQVNVSGGEATETSGSTLATSGGGQQQQQQREPTAEEAAAMFNAFGQATGAMFGAMAQVADADVEWSVSQSSSHTHTSGQQVTHMSSSTSSTSNKVPYRGAPGTEGGSVSASVSLSGGVDVNTAGVPAVSMAGMGSAGFEALVDAVKASRCVCEVCCACIFSIGDRFVWLIWQSSFAVYLSFV